MRKLIVILVMFTTASCITQKQTVHVHTPNVVVPDPFPDGKSVDPLLKDDKSK
jgi:hypothetical protein